MGANVVPDKTVSCELLRLAARGEVLSTMNLSVIIPVYNRFEALPAALASVRNQLLPGDEVIVVDDGSREDPSPYLPLEDSRVRLLRQANAGPGVARNSGIREAKNAYVAFLDSDDLWLPWTRAMLEQAHELHPEVSFISGGWIEFRDSQSLPQQAPAEFSAQAFEHYYAAAFEDFMVGPGGVAVKREAALEVGGFAEKVRVAEDIDFWLRLGMEPGFVLVRQPALYGYRVASGPSLTGNTEELRKGSRLLVDQERAGCYPGGEGWQATRWHLLTRTLRPAMLRLTQGDKSDRETAWSLYRATFGWHRRLGRWKFLAGFPFK